MKFIDMFCGMGTVRMGFEQAGHECVYSIEWDKHKRKIYEVIFGNEPEGKDIRTVTGSDLPISDCWAFGAPCQDFSIAGTRAGMEGDRSSLVKEVFRLVRETEEKYRPEWLLYENVKGMLSSNKGFDYLEILCEMASLGYDIEFQLLNTFDFRIPQNRERVYTIGHIRTRGARQVLPIRQDDKLFSGARVADEAQSQAKMGYVRQVGNVMPIKTRDNPNQGRVYDPNGIAPCLNKMEGGGRCPIIIEPCACLTPDRMEKRQNGRRFKEPGEPMFTLTKQDIHGVKQGDRIRRLTPRECFRLQGVSDEVTDRIMAAGISDTQMYRAAGDACTVNVIYEIAKRMAIGKLKQSITA